MCDCLNHVERELKEKFAARVSEGGEISSSETGWDNQVIDFTFGRTLVMLNFKFAYRAKKKNGEMAKNLTRLDTKVKMSHCPFCGVKYDN